MYTVNNYLKHNVVMDGDMVFSTEGRFDHGEEGGERSSAQVEKNFAAAGVSHKLDCEAQSGSKEKVAKITPSKFIGDSG